MLSLPLALLSFSFVRLFVHLIHSSPDPLHLPSFPTRRSSDLRIRRHSGLVRRRRMHLPSLSIGCRCSAWPMRFPPMICRSEEHTSELQSRGHLVCRLLLEKKNSLVYNSSVQ